MKLVRNTTPDGSCKYAAIRMDKARSLSEANSAAFQHALAVLRNLGVLELGAKGSEDEFFLLKLKDRHSTTALWSYATSIHASDPEFSDDVAELAKRSGERNPWCKEPDTAPAAYGVSVLEGQVIRTPDPDGGPA